MRIEKYEPANLSALVPLERDAVLDELDRLLDDDALFAEAKADFAQRRPQTLNRGRHSTPVEVILRMLLVKHLYNWSYEQTERFVADSITLRQFCRLYWQSVPDDTVLIKWANLLQHYHNGVEGRISVPKRRHELDRCRYHGKKGFERWVGWGIIAHNLHVIGSALTAD